MSLLISGSAITIQNRDGTSKFTSSDKLVHKSYTETGSASLGGSYGATATYTPSTSYTSKELALIYVTITAGDGNVTSTTLNSTIQLGFPFLMHFDHSNTETKITAWDTLTAMLIPANSVTGQAVRLQFTAMSLLSGGWLGPERIVAASTTVSFDWKLVVLSYQ